MSGQSNKIVLDLLTAVDDETVISQAALGERLGVAAGLVNFMMKRAISKGLVTVKKAPARRYAYLLTPSGFAEKAWLIADYMNTSLGMFRRVRANFANIFGTAVARGTEAPEFVIVGDLELAEIALLEALRYQITLAGVVCEKTNRGSLGGVPIFSQMSELPNDVASYAKYIVADIYKGQERYEWLVERFGADRVVVLDMLRVREVKAASSSGAEFKRQQS